MVPTTPGESNEYRVRGVGDESAFKVVVEHSCIGRSSYGVRLPWTQVHEHTGSIFHLQPIMSHFVMILVIDAPTHNAVNIDITLRPRFQVADDFSQLRLELDDYPRFLVTSICEEVVC